MTCFKYKYSLNCQSKLFEYEIPPHSPSSHHTIKTPIKYNYKKLAHLRHQRRRRLRRPVGASRGRCTQPPRRNTRGGESVRMPGPSSLRKSRDASAATPKTPLRPPKYAYEPVENGASPLFLSVLCLVVLFSVVSGPLFINCFLSTWIFGMWLWHGILLVRSE